MNNYLYIGKIVSTHGIKGELKVISDIDHKDKIFKINNNIYVTENYKVEKIISYRVHKQYDLIAFEGYEDINLIDEFIGKNIYVKIDELELKEDEYIISELIGAEVIEETEKIGIIEEIEKGKKYNYIKVKGEKIFLVPLIDEYIVRFEKKEKKLYTKNAKQLII